LTIDPILSYSTYLGGLNFDQANGSAVDALGNAYVAGFTSSANFPTTSGAFDTIRQRQPANGSTRT
jgi:beta-propeller repeat-containing protein